MDLKPEGSLAERDFPTLVHALHETRWSGILTLSNKGVGKSVTVQEGRLVFASSTSPDERLGELLLRKGRIALRQYVDAGKLLGPGKRLGTVLVESGVLSPKDLVKAVVEHTQEIIYNAFQWTEGHYRLQERAESAEAITLKISTPDIIMEGIRRIEAWSRIDRAVGGLAAQYQVTDRAHELARGMILVTEQNTMLDLLAAPQDVEMLCSSSTMADFDVCRTLWAFRVIGIAQRLDTPAPVPQDAEDEGLGFVISGEDQ